MRARLLALLLFLALAGQARAAISVIQEPTPVQATASATTIATTLTLTAGSYVVVWVAYDNISGSITCTLASSNSETITQRINVGTGSTVPTLRGFTFGPAVGGSTTLTATFGSSVPNRGIWPAEVGQSNAYQTQASQLLNAPGNGTDAVTTGNMTPTSQPALVVALMRDIVDTTTGNVVRGTGYSAGTTGWATITGGADVISENLRITSTAALPATWTNSAGSPAASFLTGAVVFTEAAGGGPTFTGPVDWLDFEAGL